MRRNFSFQFLKTMFICVFFVWVFHPTGELFTHTKMSSIPVKGCTFLSMISAPLAIEQWGFFSAPHLLWHVTYVYKGYPWGPVTLTPVAECLTVELSLPVLTTKVSRGWDSNTRPTADCLRHSLVLQCLNVDDALSILKLVWSNMFGMLHFQYKQVFKNFKKGKMFEK